MFKVLLIALGGVVGTLLRYYLGGAIQRSLGRQPGVEGDADGAAAASATGVPFPIGTLAVNMMGCLAIGFLASALTAFQVREEYRLAVLVGLLGGFTTFSTYGYDTFAMAGRAQWGYAGLNLVLSNAAGVAAVWLGHLAAQKWWPAG